MAVPDARAGAPAPGASGRGRGAVGRRVQRRHVGEHAPVRDALAAHAVDVHAGERDAAGVGDPGEVTHDLHDEALRHRPRAPERVPRPTAPRAPAPRGRRTARPARAAAAARRPYRRGRARGSVRGPRSRAITARSIASTSARRREAGRRAGGWLGSTPCVPRHQRVVMRGARRRARGCCPTPIRGSRAPRPRGGRAPPARCTVSLPHARLAARPEAWSERGAGVKEA
jgi:hypothetical protein